MPVGIIKGYLQQIQESKWKEGNCSESTVFEPYFFKRRAEAPSEIHNFLINGSLNIKLGSISPPLEDYCVLSEYEILQIGYKNKIHNYYYAFKKVNFVEFKDYFKNPKEYIPVLHDLATFFYVLDKEGIVYHDACWGNIGINGNTQKLCVVDMDSMEKSTEIYKSEQIGSILFHRSFNAFKKKYKLRNIEYLNACIYHNIFFAFVLGLEQHDDQLTLMKKNTVVNNLVKDYIEENYTDKLTNGSKIDKHCVNVLKQATEIVSSYIKGEYKGNPYDEIASLANKFAYELKLKSILPYLSIFSKQTLKYFEKKPSVGIGIVVIILIFVAVYLYPNLSSLGSNINGQQILDQIIDFRGIEDNSEIVTSKNNESSENSTNYTNLLGMEFVKIPAGSFSMGSPDEENSNYNDGPVHNVTIEKSFYLGKYEVTQKQWSEVMGNDPSEFRGDDLPVESVSWNDVQQFIEKLNEREGTDKYRLPSEAEWEYACRAGTITSYSFGDDESEIGDYAWYKDNSDDKTHPVGLKKPNPWGLYDMDGNVWELCQDTYHKDYDGAPSDNSAWESGDRSFRVRRGGVWCRSAKYCNSAARGKIISSGRSNTLGFRILMEC